MINVIEHGISLLRLILLPETKESTLLFCKWFLYPTQLIYISSTYSRLIQALDMSPLDQKRQKWNHMFLNKLQSSPDTKYKESALKGSLPW